MKDLIHEFRKPPGIVTYDEIPRTSHRRQRNASSKEKSTATVTVIPY